MDRRFTFDAGSSDEEQPPSDYQSSSSSEEEEEEAEEELPSSSFSAAAAGNNTKSKKKSQSPWEFSNYSESVAEEHLRRKTTSVDDKIYRARVENKIKTHGDSDDENTDDIDEREGFELEEDERKEKGNEAAAFFSSSEGASFHADSFLELNLSRPLLKACDALGYKKPTPIQAACVPLALAGRDISGSAITGSGKTAAFGLPILERLLFRPKRVNAIRVLVLTPTRELAVQVHSMIEKLAQFTDIRCCLVAGGLSLKMQEAALRSRPDIVVATPGRMIDHLRNSQSVGLEDLAVLILDEADRLLEMNFSAEIRELVDLCPKQRQTMLFSATMTDEVNELIKLSLNKPVRLSADPSTKRPSALIEEVIRIRPTREANQEAVLLSLCSRNFKTKVIIFSGTKKEAHRLKILFGLSGLKAAELHADLTQAQRLDALEIFRKGEVDFLCATDVAARGLDIVGVQTVINFTCPQNITSYVHRVGRTARAGKEGYAITFVTERDRSLLKAIVKRAGSKLLSRTVAQASIVKWSQRIEEMEDQVAAIIEEERTEKILRKAEMEAAKAENMIEHKLEIFSRPRRTWFETEKEKKAAVVAAKVSKENSLDVKNLTKSVEQADKEEKKERKRQVIEKNLPRKKRRRLEAEREMLHDEDNGNEKKVRGEKSLVDLGYRQAKSIKSNIKAQQSGKVLKKRSKDGRAPSRIQSRKKEIQELFEGERSLKKDMRGSTTAKKKVPKSSFKSKSRYKRRK